MEALICRKLGDPTIPPDSSEDSPLTISKSHPFPQLVSPTSVRIRVKATSLNFATYLLVQGKYQDKSPLPFVVGSDYSGTVEAIGPRVINFKVGDPVCAVTTIGSFAQFIVADESVLFRVADGCYLIAAAALPLAYGTSYSSLIHRAHLTSGQVLLVLGAAGGTGIAAVQIGKICGAIVIGVARGAEKVQVLNSIGIDHAVDLSKENVIDSVKGFLKARNLKGVDTLYDPVGGKLAKESMKLLNWGAQILVIGFASGEVPIIPANIALVKNWTIHGFYWGNYGAIRPGARKDSLKELMSWSAKGLITVPISHTFGLSQVHRAFAAIRDRKVIGKVMIVFDDTKTLYQDFSLFQMYGIRHGWSLAITCEETE